MSGRRRIPKSGKTAPPPKLNPPQPTSSSSESVHPDENFEKELYWCIEQLELGLTTKKDPDASQIEEAAKLIRSLKNPKAPLVKKRQIMRKTFGDYRKKMMDEEKSLKSSNFYGDYFEKNFKENMETTVSNKIRRIKKTFSKSVGKGGGVKQKRTGKKSKKRRRKVKNDVTNVEELFITTNDKSKDEEDRENLMMNFKVKKELKIMESEERRKCGEELKELIEIWNYQLEEFNKRNETNRLKSEWQDYINGKFPNQSSERDINTFLAILKESQFIGINTELNRCQKVLQIINAVNHIQSDENFSNSRHECILKLEDNLIDRLDRISEKILFDAEKYVSDKFAENLHKELNFNEIRLGVWGNLSKSSKGRTITMECLDMNITIPKHIFNIDYGIRILKIDYDHLSHKSKSFLKKEKIENTTIKNNNLRGKTTTEREKSFIYFDDKDKKEFPFLEKLCKFQMNLFHLKNIEQIDYPIIRVNSDDEQYIVSDTLKDSQDSNFFDSTTTKLYQKYYNKPYIVDLRSYSLLYSIYHIDLVQLPPQPHQIKPGTILRKIEEPKGVLKYFHNVIVPETNSVKETIVTARSSFVESTYSFMKHIKSDLSESLSKIYSNDSENNIVITIKISTLLFTSGNIFLARWDGDDWVTNGFYYEKYDDNNKSITFRPKEFGPYGIFYDLHCQYPFKDWIIQPIYENTVVIILYTTMIRIEIKVTNNLVTLINPNILQGEFEPSIFVRQLKDIGLNIFPTNDAKNYVNTLIKDASLEERLYRSISLIAPAFAVANSKLIN
ncbi:DgyrCDS5083 [Dimorphilus gyrociliatus]|uniref:DgyrCDS5083 n=1 Tax=Dimorphilus gyrociliatus TaxID=2664684 RepID=A0A7I8VIQ9_9ANNE|nr:DgyrCDS5083 [Dimorphilus gyrociliatus]